MPRFLSISAIRGWAEAGRTHTAVFWRWWGGELAALLPTQVKALFNSGPAPLSLRIGPAGLTISDGPFRPLARLPIDETSAIPASLLQQVRDRGGSILLPREAVLRRRIAFPVAAEREVAAAISFEIDRQTPFAPERVYRTFRIHARDLKRKTMEVDLAVVPRTVVDAALATTGRYGIKVTAVQADGDDGSPPFNFLPAGYRRHSQSWRAEPWRPVALAAAVILALGLSWQIWSLHAEAEALESKVASMRDIAERGEKARAKVEAATASAHFLPDKQTGPRAVEVVDALSRILPDDTWLFDLEITGREVRIGGYSSAVPALIERLQQSPLFETPQLRAPVVHGASRMGDRFEISMSAKRGAP